MPIRTSAEYIQSLKGRNLKVYLFGELVKEPVDHPMIRPSINAVAYLTESLHGAGSPQTQRIQIASQMQLGYKKRLAKRLAGVKEDEEPEEHSAEQQEYFDRIFNLKKHEGIKKTRNK